MKIREIRKEDYSKIISLVEKLPEWFTEEAREKQIPLALETHEGYVAEENDKILGFITMDSHYGEAKIGWIGVHPEHHHEGIGRELVDRLAEEFKDIGADSIRVETVAREDAKGSPYEATLNFYKSMGFEVDEIVEGGFDDGETDKAIYKKRLNKED